MKIQYKWLLIKDCIILFAIFLMMNSYFQYSYQIKCWIRSNLYGDVNPEETLKERENLELVDNELSKYKPLFLAYDMLTADDDYEMTITYICNNGDIYQYSCNSDSTESVTKEELMRPAYLRALCEYRAKIDDPIKKVDSMAELQDAYYDAVQIQDRESVDTIIMGNEGTEEFRKFVDSMNFCILGYLYASGTEIIPTQYYIYQDGVSQSLSDPNAGTILAFLQIFTDLS